MTRISLKLSAKAATAARLFAVLMAVIAMAVLAVTSKTRHRCGWNAALPDYACAGELQ